MFGSRTVKTLVALCVAMFLGASVLILMETAPIRPASGDLAAVGGHGEVSAALVARTDLPLQRIKWRNIVIHSTAPGEQQDIASRCHFVIDSDETGGPGARATMLWDRQAEGYHVAGVSWRDFNTDSVGVCLVGDFSRRRPSSRQIELLVELVRAIQRACNIPADHVYLHSDLDRRTDSPGAAFPVREFTARLLRR